VVPPSFISRGRRSLRTESLYGKICVANCQRRRKIDIQISVLHYDDVLSYKDKIENAGFVFREENPDKTKRYIREIPKGATICDAPWPPKSD
jgi:hypothetical protein